MEENTEQGTETGSTEVWEVNQAGPQGKDPHQVSEGAEREEMVHRCTNPHGIWADSTAKRRLGYPERGGII